jgi:hypothetical protein
LGCVVGEEEDGPVVRVARIKDLAASKSIVPV